MSSSDKNTTFKKTSFLSGINSEFINKFYSDYLSDPESLPESWKKFFDGLSEDEKLILNRSRRPGSSSKVIGAQKSRKQKREKVGFGSPPGTPRGPRIYRKTYRKKRSRT